MHLADIHLWIRTIVDMKSVDTVIISVIKVVFTSALNLSKYMKVFIYQRFLNQDVSTSSEDLYLVQWKLPAAAVHTQYSVYYGSSNSFKLFTQN